MKKMMIALLVVASIFVLASCAPAVITQTLTLKSIDGVAASGTVLTTMDANSNAYYLDSSTGKYELLGVQVGTYGTLSYTKTQVSGSNKDSFIFSYKGSVGATGSEGSGKAYIGVLNSDAKSFKTKYAEVTINASAEWTGSTPVAVALNTTTTEAKKTFAAAGDKIYVDGKEYSAAVDVKSAADAKIGTLAAELTVEKTGIKFTFTDDLAATADSVSGKEIKVEVKNGTTVVATYNVTCSHVGTPAPQDEITLTAESQAIQSASKEVTVSTTGTSLKVYQVLKSGRKSPLGTISTKTAETTYVDEVIENELTGVAVGLFKIKAVGKTQLTGIKFILDTNVDGVGAGAETYELVFEDADKVEVAKYTVNIVVTSKVVSVNNVSKEVEVPAPNAAGKNYYFLYDAVGTKWILIDSVDSAAAEYGSPVVYNEDDDYCGVLSNSATGNDIKIKFTTQGAYLTSAATTPTEASTGKGVAIIGVATSSDPISTTNKLTGSFIISYENVEVINTIEVVSSAEDDGKFEIEGGTKYTLYKRELTVDSSKSKFVWGEWKEAGKAGENDVFYGVYTQQLVDVGTLSFVPKASVFKCQFIGSTESGHTKKVGYIQLAVVDNATNEVLSSYQVEGTNDQTASV